MPDEVSPPPAAVPRPPAAAVAPALPAQYPPRFILAGVLMNVFQSPAGEKDGQKWGGEYRLQLMSADHLKNGETKLTPTDVKLGIDPAEAERYKAGIGKIVKLPVTVYAIGRDLVCTLAREGGK